MKSKTRVFQQINPDVFIIIITIIKVQLKPK